MAGHWRTRKEKTEWRRLHAIDLAYAPRKSKVKAGRSRHRPPTTVQKRARRIARLLA